MYNQKSIFICIFLFSLISCKSTKSDAPYSLSKKTPFTISFGSFQEWIAGVQGGGSGVNLVVHFEEVSDGVVFKELYFRKQISEVIQPIPKRIEAAFKGEINQRQDVVMDESSIKEAVNTPPFKFPFELLRDEAVLKYSYKGKTNYTKIGPMIEETTIAYPSAPPNNEDGGKK